MSKVRMITASELVEDFDLYPRHDVNSHNVTKMVEALEAGEELPPLRVCASTKRVVDGFHRRRAWIRHAGEDIKVPCVLVKYESDADLFADAMRCNSAHGYQMDRFDQIRSVLKAKALGLESAVIASALRLTSERVDELLTRTAQGPVVGKQSSKPEAKTERGWVPLKATIAHMSGKKLTRGQSEANEKLSGMNPTHYVNQLILLLKNDLMPAGDDIDKALRVLAELIEKRISAAV